MGNFKILSEAIIAKSSAKIWSVARLEWSLVGIENADEPHACLCSHHPIIELCYLRNRVNGNDAMVGNVCVKRFLGLRSDLIFDGIKRVQEDPDKALNQAAIDFFWHRNVISPWERDFLESTGARRILSGRQLQFRRDINAKVLRAFRRINVAMAKEQVGE